MSATKFHASVLVTRVQSTVPSRSRISPTTHRKTLIALALATSAAVASLALPANAATIDWNGSTNTDWTNNSNWSATAPANDITPDFARFDQATYVNQPTVAAATNTEGLIFGDSTGQLRNSTGALAGAGTSAAVTITATGQDFGMGDGGIVMNANSGNVTINTGRVRIWTTQTWSNASSSVLTISGGVDRKSDLSSRFGVLNIANTGTGSVVVSGLANDATGIVGPWLSYTTSSGTFYATSTAGTIGAFNAGAAQTDFSTVSTATTNYDVNLTGSNVITGSAAANTIRYTGGNSTIQINGSGTLTTNGLLNASGAKLTVAAGAGATGGLVMGSATETVILPKTGDIDVLAAIINPATNIGPHRYYLTVGGGTAIGGHTVFVNNIVNNSADGSDLVISATNGPAGSLNDGGQNQLMIGSSKNLTLNAASGPIFLGDAIVDGQGSGDNDTGGPGDLGITESVPGSTVTIAGTHMVALNGQSNFTGGLILMPGANLYVNNWTTTSNFGTGPITFMGNNTVAKYLNRLDTSFNNRINLNGDIEFTGSPLGNTHPWGAENNSIVFVHSGNAGTGEVHLGANVTINTDTQPDPNVIDPTQWPTSYMMGGIFDDGHGYGLTKTGTGTMVFQSSDTYGDTASGNFTGPLTVLQGTLQLGQFGPGSSALTTRDNLVTVDTGATFYVNNGGQTIAGLNDGPHGGGTADGNVTVTLAGAGSYSFSGVITGGRSITKTSIGTQNLSGSNTYSGNTNVNGGKLNLNFGAAGTPPAADILYNNIDAGPLSMGGGTLQLTGAAGGTNSQRFGSISVSRTSAIRLISNGAPSLLLSAGNLTRAGSGTTLDITLPTGAQTATNGMLTTARNTNGILGSFATVSGASGTDWAVSNAVHTPAGVTVQTPGTWDGDDGDLDIYGSEPNGAAVSFNTITGPIPAGVVAGTLYYVVGSNFTGGSGTVFKIVTRPGASTPFSNPFDDSGTLSIDAQGNVVPLAAYASFVGSGSVASDNTLLTGNGSVTASESINSLKIATSGTGQSLNVAGSQTLTLGSGGLLFTGAADYTISGGAGAAVAATSTELVVQQFGAGNLTIAVPFGGTTLTKAGTGKLTLTANNTYSGTTNLNGGTVEINTLQALGNGAAINFNGGTLRYGTGFLGANDITQTTAAAARAVAFNGNGATIDTNGINVSFANIITGLGGLTKVGIGTLTLGPVNRYAGPTVISGGVVSVVNNDVAVTNTSGTITNTNGQITGLASTAGLFVGQVVEGTYIDGTSGGPDLIPAGTFITAILDSTSVSTNQTGLSNGASGTTTLTASFRPNVALGAPAANADQSGSLGMSSYAAANLILDGGTLQYLASGTSTGRLFTLTQNGGTIDSSSASNGGMAWTSPGAIGLTGSGARTLTLTGSSTGLSWLGASIADGTGGATSVIKNGVGTWALNGTSTYTGTTTVNAGTLGGSGKLASTIVGGTGAHTIAPSAGLAGNTATTLTAGGLTTNSHTTLAFNLNTHSTPTVASVNDKIIVNGTVNVTGGGTLAITNHNNGQPSLGYYKAIGYTTLTGPAAHTPNLGITMPAIVNSISYVLDTAHDAGFIDIHRGFLGDANDDGIVNAIDLGILATNFNSTSGNWSLGDYNGDGIVNAIDLGILATNFNGTVGGGSFTSDLESFPTLEAAFFGGASSSSVPEPASLALLGIGAAALMGRRRRNA